MSRVESLVVSVGGVAATAVLAVLFSTTGCDQRQESVTGPPASIQPTPGTQIQILSFANPPAYDQLATLTREHSMVIEEIRVNFGSFSSMYAVGGRDLAAVKPDFTEQHRTFLEMMTRTTAPGLASTRALCADLLGQDPGAIPVSIITVRGTNAVTSEIHGARFITSGEVGFIHHTESQGYGHNEQSGGIGAESISHEPWAPYGGHADVQRNYAYQDFRFNILGPFYTRCQHGHPQRTYEAETQIYNRSFANYGGYAASSLPYWYVDTGFLDDIDNFTIGTARANLLYPWTSYFTYLSLRPESASTAVCRIKGQIGHHYPTWGWPYQWYIGPDATTGTMAYLVAPAGMSWQY